VRKRQGAKRVMIQKSMQVVLTMAVLSGVLASAAQRMPLMMTVGCVAQEGDQWWLVSATEPVEITEEVPPEPEVATVLGDGRFRLIGTLDEFGVNNHAGHKVRVKGILIEDNDETRLNLTSIRHMLPDCK